MIFQLAVIAGMLLANPQGNSEQSIKNPGLAATLAKMVKTDQDLRLQVAQLMKEGKPLDHELIRKLSWIDGENTGRMRQIVKTYGWPTFETVGKKGGDMAWLLIQHADHAPKFQRECLDLMTPLVATGQVGKSNYAYLTDRVLLSEGKKQLYATQFIQEKDGTWGPRPLEDPENVDRRRAEMGLGTLADYRKRLEEMYGKKPPTAT